MSGQTIGNRHDYRAPQEKKHTEPLVVSCDHCLRETTLPIARRNAAKFCPETCDGAIGARHRQRIMLGPEGQPNA